MGTKEYDFGIGFSNPYKPMQLSAIKEKPEEEEDNSVRRQNTLGDKNYHSDTAEPNKR